MSHRSRRCSNTGSGLQDAEVDEAGLLDARDHLELDAGLVTGPLDEPLVVLGLAHGAGGHGPDGRVVDVGDLLEAAQRGHAAVDGVGVSTFMSPPPRAEAHHLLLRSR